MIRKCAWVSLVFLFPLWLWGFGGGGRKPPSLPIEKDILQIVAG